MNSLILGAGPLGRSLARRLLEKGENVVLLNRSASNLPVGVSFIHGDLTDDSCLEHFRGVDRVYHTANPPYHRWNRELIPLWQSILTKSGEVGTDLIVATNLYAYGPPKGPSLMADHPWDAHTKKGRLRRLVEGLCAEEREKGRRRVVLVRGSDFYGPGVTQSVLGERFFVPLLQNRQPAFFGRPGKRHSYTFIDDFARTLTEAAYDESGERFQYLVPNAPALDAEDMVGILQRLLGRSFSPRYLSRPSLYLGALFLPDARELIEMLYEFEEDFITDTQEETELLNIQPTSLYEGLKQTLAWYTSRLKGEEHEE